MRIYNQWMVLESKYCYSGTTVNRSTGCGIGSLDHVTDIWFRRCPGFLHILRFPVVLFLPGQLAGVFFVPQSQFFSFCSSCFIPFAPCLVAVQGLCLSVHKREMSKYCKKVNWYSMQQVITRVDYNLNDETTSSRRNL